MERMYVEIPVKPHIKKYLDNNTFLKRPFQLTSTDPVGIVLMNLLQPVPKYYKPRRASEYSIKAYNFVEAKNTNSFMNVAIGAHYAVRGKLYISDEGINTFNAYVDSLIRLEMFHYVETLSGRGEKVRTLINDFMARYDITEEDMTLHALEKAWYRWKKRSETI